MTVEKLQQLLGKSRGGGCVWVGTPELSNGIWQITFRADGGVHIAHVKDRQIASEADERAFFKDLETQVGLARINSKFD